MSFVELARHRRSALAVLLLRTHTCPSHLVKQRDSCGDSALAWAAYNAGRSRGAAELVQAILSHNPAEARWRSRPTDMLPLHEAAWGNAPASVAVLLCMAYPTAVFALARSGETPHQLGHYYHPHFAWPRPEELLEYARNMRVRARQLKCLRSMRRLEVTCQTPPPAVLAAVFGLPHAAAAVTANFLCLIAMPIPLPSRMAPQPAPSSEVLWECVSAKRLPLNCACRRMRPPRGRNLRPSAFSHVAPDEVEFVREPAHKSGGRFAGARHVRNRRCSFMELALLQTGASGTVHQLKQHFARQVHSEVQHCLAEAKWPSKRQFRIERARDRADKFDIDCLL